MNRVVKSFGPNAIVLDKDGNEVELFEGIILYDTDQIIGAVEFEEVSDEDLPQPEELTPEQLAILAGADPTQVLEETAAGAGQSGPEDGGGSTFISLDRIAAEILPEAGYPTGTFVYNYEDPLDDGEQLLVASFYESEIEPPITPEEVISFDPPLIPVDQEPEPSQDQVQEPSPVEPEEEPPVDEGEDEVPEQPEVLPEDPIDDVEDDPEPDENSEDDVPDEDNETDTGDSDEEEPSEPVTSTGQNPGNDKPVGNSPFDGTKGASNDDEGDEGPHSETLEISDVLDTEQTEEEIIPGQNAPRGPQGNNGWGNGDDDAPGGSLEHNNGENNLDGLLSPTEQYYDV